MINRINEIEEYESFIRDISSDRRLSDPHFVYSKDNLYNALKKKNQMAFVSSQNNSINGLFVWLVIEEECYAEMIIGLVRTQEAMVEMLDYIEDNYKGYQADFVINPENVIIRSVLEAKKARFATEQQRMIYDGRDLYINAECVEEYTPKWEKEYCSMHNRDTYWTAERVINATDKFRVLLAIDKQELVGYMDVTHCFDMNEPYDLYVKPEKANMGYKKLLLESALKRNNPKTMMVLVDVDNYDEISLYEAAGFETMEGQNSIYASYVL